MIVFDLECADHGHRFEGWFASSEDFARQSERGLLVCPQCGTGEVIKAPMAPRLARKGNQLPAPAPAPTPAPGPTPVKPASMAAPAMPPEMRAAFEKMALLQAEMLKSSRWVGEDFADKARAIHYGEQEAEQIHGATSAQEARDLLEEGIAIAPVLFPIAPPDELN
jgi:hypothetical protein